MAFDPQAAQGIGDNIIAVYARAELYLIEVIRDAIIAAGEAPTWAEAQLLAIRQQRGRIQGISEELQRLSPQLWEDVTQRAFLRGQIEAEKELATIPSLTPAATVINDAAVYALAAEQVGRFSQIHRGILRRTDDIWRAINAEVTGMTVTGTMTVKEAAQRSFTRMTREGLGFFVDKAGRKWGLDTYAEMAVRTSTHQALRMGHTETMQQYGVDLVVISSHANPAEVCAPYENKILSLTGKFPNGRQRIGDQIFTVTASMSEAEAAGLHHPNCAHGHFAYVPGYTKVDPTTNSTYDEAGYKATQKQRYYERQIRKSKQMESAATTDEALLEAKRRKSAYQAKLRDHISEHDLKRRPDREQLMRAGDKQARRTRRATKATTTNAYADGLRTSLDAPDLPTTPTRRRRRAASGQGVSVADILARNQAKTTPSPQMRDAMALKQAKLAAPLDHVDIDLPAKPVFKEKQPSTTLAALPRTNRTSWEEIQYDTNTYQGVGNCIRVANSVELRRRGYDVTAGQTAFRVDYNTPANRSIYITTKKTNEELLAASTKISQSTESVAITGWNTADGKTRIYFQEAKARRGVKYGKNGATLKRFEEDMPEGATGTAVGSWSKGNSGHIWNWVKEDGEIKFFEAQTNRGFIDNTEYMSRLKAGSLRMVRMDDLTPNEDVLKVIDYENRIK